MWGGVEVVLQVVLGVVVGVVLEVVVWSCRMELLLELLLELSYGVVGSSCFDTTKMCVEKERERLRERD